MPLTPPFHLPERWHSVYLAHGMRVFAVTAAACLALAWWLTFSQARTTAYQSVKASTEAANSALTQVFVNQAWQSLREPLGLAADRPLSPDALSGIDQTVKQFCLKTDIVKIKIFNLAGTTVYSSDPRQIGDDKSASHGFRQARSGSAASEMSLRGTFNTLNGEVYDRNLVSSYVPIVQNGMVEAVAEIYTDRTDAIQATDRALRSFGATLMLIFLAVYAALAFFMRQARRISEAYQNSLVRLAEESSAAREAAEHATRVKSQFLATMSHEIRTPMNGLLGTAQLLRDSPLTPQQSELVQLLQVSGESLLALLNDILDLSKIEAGRLDLDPHPFRLADLLGGVQALLAVRAQEKSIAFHARMEPTLAPVWQGDALRIRQILLNLGGNAVKFTEHGHVSLEVGMANAGVQFVVTDTGIGMTGDTLDKLFTKFTQADASIARRHGGTGLGLAISQSLATAMGGHIMAASEPGQGSRFTLWLPLHALPDDTPLPSAAPGHTPGSAATSPATRPVWPGARVLVAEDNPINQTVIRTLLDRMGLTVTLAANGSEAVERAAQEPFDLVLMDMQMPVMDGLEATRRIRQNPGIRAELPIVALTANAMETDRQACLAAGMNDFLSKPLRPQELVSCLIRHLGPPPAAATQG